MKRKVDQISEDDAREKVEKKFENRLGLIQHFAAYLIVNGILWMLYWSSDGGFPWPLFVTAFWGIGMVSHAADYYYRYGKGAQKREAEIETEITRELRLSRAREELQRQQQYDAGEIEGAMVYDLKNLKEPGLRLSDDGELVDVESWDGDGLAQRRYSD